MTDTISNNKRIAKNAILLYVRMFFSIVIGLYTSRVILNSLGISDYGIYNLVGGVVSMLSFLNVGMSGATQRFITYELGKGNIDSLRNVFCNSVITHFALALFIVLLMEPIGLWLVNHKLVIPESRLFAANCTLQCSIITMFISVICVPYNACIIAHEHMGSFAYISILDTILKLIVAILIAFSPFDKLILYAILILCIQLLIRITYTVYCKRKFNECTFQYRFDRRLFLKMFSFAGWGCIGNMGFSFKDQLSNIILNLFFGTSINAARGIATQINNIINSFAANFTTALNPQITKEYANKNLGRSYDLTMAGSKYAFYLLSIISVPFVINVDYLLKLWLGTVPEYTSQFVTIVLLSSCIYSMSHTMSTAILATGHIKVFQSVLAILLLSEAPLAYMILYFGGTPYMAVIPSIITNALSLFLRIFILHHYIPMYSPKFFFINIFLKNILILIIIFIPVYYIGTFFSNGFIRLIITSLSAIIMFLILIYSIGLDKYERDFVHIRIRNFLK